MPTDIKPRILTTAINEDDSTASLALAMDVAKYFELDSAKAREIAKQVGKSVSKWSGALKPRDRVLARMRLTGWLPLLSTKI